MRSSVRWLVPIAAATVVAGGAVINTATADNSPQLSGKTPAQLLEAMAGADVTALSGTVVTRADLGLPSLPQLSGSPSTDTGTDPTGLITRFLSGKNTIRVWADGPTKQRAQLLDPFSELDVVRNGQQVWTYASKTNTVQHGTMTQRPDQLGRKGSTGSTPSASATDMTPAQLAQRALAAADPSTTVSVGASQTVANRPAYGLTLTPKDAGTLVDHVVIAVDADKSVPLQVQVFAKNHSDPVIETGYTAISFDTPDAAEFTFTPPSGAKVTELDQGTAKPSAPSGTTAAKPTTTGSGWATIVEIPASTIAKAQQAAPSSSASQGSSDQGSSAQGSSDQGSPSGQSGADLLKQLGTPVTGGRAITSSLVSVLFTDDGRVLAGAVPVDALTAAAGK